MLLQGFQLIGEGKLDFLYVWEIIYHCMILQESVSVCLKNDDQSKLN